MLNFITDLNIIENKSREKCWLWSRNMCCICFLHTLGVHCVLRWILIFARGGGGLITTFDVKFKSAYTSYKYHFLWEKYHAMLCKYHCEVQISFQNFCYCIIFCLEHLEVWGMSRFGLNIKSWYWAALRTLPPLANITANIIICHKTQYTLRVCKEQIQHIFTLCLCDHMHFIFLGPPPPPLSF